MTVDPGGTLVDWLAAFNRDGAGGQNRLVYSADWLANQSRLIQLGQALGGRARVDRMGTVYLDFPGSGSGLVATGSHMDTVKNGGRYDGLYGVLGGLAAIRRLKEAGPLKATLRLISFSEEEGSRFPAAFTGSRYYLTGQRPGPLTDAAGVAFDDAAAGAVAQLTALPGVTPERPGLPDRWLELHIEQGPVLEDRGLSIGLVNAIVGQRRYLVTVPGRRGHAGTTPMAGRQDAVRLASRLINAIYTRGTTPPAPAVMTVGQVTVRPNVDNVIADRVAFTVDARDAEAAVLDRFAAGLKELVATAPGTRLKEALRVAPTPLDGRMLEEHVQIAARLGLPSRGLDSGAGHDSQLMAARVPTAMLFVPSQGGVSHCPQEKTAAGDLEDGVRMLTACLAHWAREGVAK